MQCDDIMLDLETMGTGSNAAIIAIGAVAIDRSAVDNVYSKFYCVIDLASSVEHGGIVDKDTEAWWSRQSPEARRILDDPTIERLTIDDALFKFAGWLKGVGLNKNKTNMWGNGADFDNVILMNAYNRIDLDQPWGKYNNRCYRTLKSLRPGLKMVRIGTHHNALDDAHSQALHLLHLVADIEVPPIVIGSKTVKVEAECCTKCGKAGWKGLCDTCTPGITDD